jgi:hypothetical protein
MRLDNISKMILDLVYAGDSSNILTGGVYHSEDPDKIPDQIPACTFLYLPAPYQRVYNEVYVDLTFWFDNPNFEDISKIIDTLERLTETWIAFELNNINVGKCYFTFLRSPSSGGRNNLKYILVRLKLRAVFFEDTC